MADRSDVCLPACIKRSDTRSRAEHSRFASDHRLKTHNVQQQGVIPSFGRILGVASPNGGEEMDRFTAAHVRTAGSYGALSSRSAPLLAGRTLEQIFLREELAAVQRGHGRLVLLGGEAGIGKTTLARDLADEAMARGACVLSGACYDLTN